VTPADKIPVKPATKPETTARRLVKRRLRWLTVLAFLLIVASGVYTLWQSVKPQVFGLRQYVVAVGDVHIITPLPKWIRSDVRGDVVREINLAGPVSILDEDLGERFYEAFAAHPWVAKVVRVLKRPPAGVDVELVYRQPVLMVQVTDGLLPLDAEGVQLLTADFSPLEAMRYPRLVIVGRETPPPAGTRWSDARVVAAAALAAVLNDAWQELGLHRLALAADPPPSAAGPFEFELFTKEGTRVLWGAAPTSLADAQAAAADKLARLRKYHADHNTLEGSRGPQTLDLRAPHGVQTSPRTASRSVPPGG
jgi:cell division septal protein FtsQ